MFMMRQIYNVFLVAVLFAAMFAGNAYSATLSVPSSYATIQDAIDQASDGDVVNVDNGTYSGSGNQDLNFNGKAIIVQSVSNDPTRCIIDCGGITRGVTFDSEEGNDSQLIGFTIQNAYTEGHGAGIYITNASPVIDNCIILDNWAIGQGAGIRCSLNSNAIIRNCRIRGNHTNDFGGGIAIQAYSSVLVDNCEIIKNVAAGGGGIFVYYQSNPVIRNSDISYNTAVATSGKFGGGGVFGMSETSPTLIDCTISHNESYDLGGGMAFVELSSFTMENCELFSNTAAYGGGIYNEGYYAYKVGRLEIKQCKVYSNYAPSFGGLYFGPGNPLIENSLVYDNQSDFTGNGIYLNAAILEVNSCTIANNFSVGDGYRDYGIFCNDAEVTVLNSIIWGHQDSSVYYNASGKASISYSDIQGGFSGTGNISDDPLFLDAGDYHLLDNSPCIGAGTSDGAPAEDLYGNSRSVPPAMGVYEFMTIPGFRSLDLSLTGDGISPPAPTGSIGDGYTLMFDPNDTHYDIGVNNFSTTTPLKSGFYPFYITSVSDSTAFSSYWRDKGIDSSLDKCSADFRLWESVNVSDPLYAEDFQTDPGYTIQNSIPHKDDSWNWDAANEWLDVQVYDTADDVQKFAVSDPFSIIQHSSFIFQYDLYVNYMGVSTDIQIGMGQTPVDGSSDFHVAAFRYNTSTDWPFRFSITDGNSNGTESSVAAVNTWYRVTIDYDQSAGTADITITERDTGGVFFSQKNVAFDPIPFDRVWIGSHTSGGEGYRAQARFDNVMIMDSNKKPAFYLHVNESGEVQLVDGPLRDSTGTLAGCQGSDDGTHDKIEIVGGNLCNTPLGTCMTELTVLPGMAISGEVEIKVRATALRPFFPVGWCISWADDNQYGYNEIINRAPAGDSQYTVKIDQTAPLSVGTYYMIFAGGDNTSGADNLFANKCGSINPATDDWNNGDDMADLGDDAYCLSNWQHWLSVPGNDAGCDVEPGIAMIKVNVVDEGSLPAFRMPGDYPNLVYSYEGRIEGANGVTSKIIPIALDVQNILLQIDDVDQDLMDDNWEVDNFGDITVTDGTGDWDNDGYSNYWEYKNGTDPKDGTTPPWGTGYDYRTDDNFDSALWTLDIDGNGEVKALTDGILAIRYLLGFQAGGDTWIDGALGAGATRTSASLIEDYILTGMNMLDVDGNGETKALTDGILVIRYLLGFPAGGDTWIDGALGSGATRTTAAEIEAYIASLMPSQP